MSHFMNDFEDPYDDFPDCLHDVDCETDCENCNLRASAEQDDIERRAEEKFNQGE